MIPSVPASIRLLQFAVVAIITTSAFSQAPPKYDRATETTLKTTVGELRLVPPSGPKPIAYLVTKAGSDKDNDSVQIFLCPKSFLDEMGIAFKSDEAIQVIGSKVKQGAGNVILAREVVKGGETLTFRFP